MKTIELKNVFLTRSGIGLKRLRLIEETIHQYKGKRNHFWKYALYQFLFKRSIKLRGKYFVIHNHWCPGYYHWITEALPRLLHIKDEVANRTLVLPESFRNLLYDSIKPFFQGKIYWIPQHRNLVIENLLIPQNPPFSGVYDSTIFYGLRETFRTVCAQRNNTLTAGRRIYVSRSKAARRKVFNETEVTGLLERNGFTTINFEDYSFWQQVAIMKEASCIVSIHGAGLTNVLFMKEGCHVIELQKNPIGREKPDVLYKDFSEMLKLNYRVQFCEAMQRGLSLQDADIIVDLQQLKSLLPFGVHQE